MSEREEAERRIAEALAVGDVGSVHVALARGVVGRILFHEPTRAAIAALLDERQAE